MQSIQNLETTQSKSNISVNMNINTYLSYANKINTGLFIHSFIHSFTSIQPQRPGWQEPESSHVTGMALAHCILGKFLGVVCHCFPPPLDIPTYAARCAMTLEILAAKGGTVGEKFVR